MASPWNEHIFKVQHDSVPLEKKQAEIFHTLTMQRLLPFKYGHLAIAPICKNMGTKTKSHRLDQVMSNAVISQANC